MNIRTARLEFARSKWKRAAFYISKPHSILLPLPFTSLVRSSSHFKISISTSTTASSLESLGLSRSFTSRRPQPSTLDPFRSPCYHHSQPQTNPQVHHPRAHPTRLVDITSQSLFQAWAWLHFSPPISLTSQHLIPLLQPHPPRVDR